jgi:predicted flap endonuclease-1-like 5' DNA nuclease
MGKYLGDDAIQHAVRLYLDTVPTAEPQRLPPAYVDGLTQKARLLAEQLERLLSQIRALADESEEQRILLYGLLKQLPVLTFEPLNYAFVGRVVIPLENVLDLLINLDIYTSGKPVRKGAAPGVVELLSISAQTTSSPSPSAQSVTNIAGIGPAYASTLRDRADIDTIRDLLAKGATAQQRAEIASKTGLSEKLLTRWVQRADLMRIDGIGEEYSELLEYGGIRSAAELADQDPEILHQILGSTNATRNLVQQLPSVNGIRSWVKQARELE